MAKSRRQSRAQVVLNDSAVLAAQCARRLLELRQHTGETQKKFAARVHMTESMVSRLERGDHVPSLATLCRIADGFERRLEIVFHEHEHTHDDGTRHTHPHDHADQGHRHEHGHDDLVSARRKSSSGGTRSFANTDSTGERRSKRAK